MAAAVVAAAGRACAGGAVRAAWRGFASVPVKGSCCSYSSLAWALQVQCSISAPRNVMVQQCRQSSFFNMLTADELWKGALAETGVGVKKARGKRRKKKLRKNLNRGQEIGEETYEDFETRVIEVKNVFCMKAKEGRKKSIRALVAIGNGKGAAGFALGKAGDRMNALRKAKNKAIRSLHYIEQYQNHTIYHDITVKFKRTTIRMKKQNKGYGLRCHRAIITICKLIGIKDMYAKVTGSKNLINITRALFKGLTQQETHQQLANEKNLYVVEFREEQGPLPIIVALPEGTIREDPEPEDDVPDTKLEWSEVKEAQGMKKSPWTNVRQRVW
ncbi:28S ribosomal protein S5, mitochondrial [Aix galericulata]|nr:28S ribosomal protein S5, mitochondrial [Aix galericulata]